jgi:hypothetical protein
MKDLTISEELGRVCLHSLLGEVKELRGKEDAEARDISFLQNKVVELKLAFVKAADDDDEVKRILMIGGDTL